MSNNCILKLDTIRFICIMVLFQSTSEVCFFANLFLLLLIAIFVWLTAPGFLIFELVNVVVMLGCLTCRASSKSYSNNSINLRMRHASVAVTLRNLIHHPTTRRFS